MSLSEEQKVSCSKSSASEEGSAREGAPPIGIDSLKASTTNTPKQQDPAIQIFSGNFVKSIEEQDEDLNESARSIDRNALNDSARLPLHKTKTQVQHKN